MSGGAVGPNSGGAVAKIIDHAQRLQAPAVAAYVRRLRAAHPNDTPAQLIERLEKQYLRAVIGSGGAVGAAAAIPGVGTVASLAAIGGESAFFIEASALLALGVAEVHGIPVDHDEHRKALVLAVILGEEGIMALAKALGSRTTPLKQVAGGAIPLPALGRINRMLLKRFMTKFAAKRAPLVVGKLLPAGIGAAVGGVGNRMLGRQIIDNARTAFGPPPAHWPIDGQVIDLPQTDNAIREPRVTPELP
ncbi:hypothetical protein KIK15_16905 [Williamsia sp. CHRR-6]|nr:hypothetical protein [Williamsia sp. CHRR-6]